LGTEKESKKVKMSDTPEPSNSAFSAKGNAGDRERECVGKKRKAEMEMLGTGKERGKWRN
jgi:hypothetical protein